MVAVEKNSVDQVVVFEVNGSKAEESVGLSHPHRRGKGDRLMLPPHRAS